MQEIPKLLEYPVQISTYSRFVGTFFPAIVSTNVHLESQMNLYCIVYVCYSHA